MQINFVERGNGFPQANDIILDHDECAAYRVLTNEVGTGFIRTAVNPMGWDNASTTTLTVEVVDYDDHYADEDAWEI